MAAIGDVVQQIRTAVAVSHDNVDAAVVVDVAERRGAAGADQRLARSAARLDLFEPYPGETAEQQVRLGVRIRRKELRLAAHTAVGLVDVEAAVVVEIEQRRAEPRKRPADRPQAGGRRIVAEKRLLVAVEGVGLAIEVHDQQVKFSVAVDVGQVDAHSRFRLAVQVDGAAHRQRRVFESTAALVDPHLVGGAVVGDEHVNPSISVHVAGDDAQPVADRGAQTCAIGHVGEGSVAVVPEERRRGRQIVRSRTAVVGHPGQTVALDLGGRLPVQIMDHEQIEEPVAIVIKKRGARAPPGTGDAGARRDVGEVTVAIAF